MRGRIVYADVPHTPPRDTWIDPLLLGSNAAIYGLSKVVSPRSAIAFREPFAPTAAERGDRPIIYVTWHRLNYACTPVFLALPAAERPTYIMHDGLASRAFSHRSCVWMGLEAFVFRRRSKVPPREQIAQYIRTTGRPILNLPDSGGPYGVVKPGILEVARASGARIVPFQVSVSRALSVGRTLKHVIPLPRCRIDVRRGAPLDGGASVDDLQRALDALA